MPATPAPPDGSERAATSDDSSTPETPETQLARREPALPDLIASRGLASALPPLVTAPLSVTRPPRASGGPAGALVAIDDTLRKPGLVRGLRLLRSVNQPGGFVCPGCAWPTPERRASFEVCERGVRAIADETSIRRAGPRLFETYTIPELSTRSDHWLSGQGRLTDPMIRRPSDNSYSPITWDDALELVAEALRELPDPDRAVFYGSAKLANEAAFTLQLLARALGTNNLASSSQLDHEASRIALAEVLGDERVSVGLGDFDHAEAIFVFGSNPGSSHPRMLASLRAAKARGAKIVAVNPMREACLLKTRSLRSAREWIADGPESVDLLVPVRVGGDLALIVGIAKATLEAGAVDRAFVDARTEGWAAYAAGLAAWSWAAVCERSGLSEEQIRAAASIYASSKATILCWGLGLTQHRAGVDTVEQLLALLLMRGNLDKPGAGPLALLEHSNTRGCWTVGLRPTLAPEVAERMAAATGLELPSTPGLDVVGALAAMRRGEVDVFMAFGGNLLSAGPDTEDVATAMRQCKLSVHVGTKLDRGQLITGETALILPSLARSEIDQDRWVSVEDMTGVVRRSAGRVAPASPALRSEVEIIAAIGARTVPDAVDWEGLGRDYDRVRALIDAAVPSEGREALARTGSVTRRPANAPAHARLPAPPAPAATESGQPELLLTIVRSHDQHDSTIYAHGDRERGIKGYRRIVFVNIADLERLGIEAFDQIDLTSEFDGTRRVAKRWVAVPHHITAGTLAAYWPEANALVPTGWVDPRSNTPAFKSVPVTVSLSDLGPKPPPPKP
jgi:molybdopterin-dependent oxidoreductase alpha subunit